MTERTIPHRVAVTRTATPNLGRGDRIYLVADEISAQTELGDVYLRSLIASQLRLGLRTCLSVCGTFALLPLVFVLFPRLGTLPVFGIGLPWAVLGVLVYPVFVVTGWLYVRRAERNEQAFADHLEYVNQQ